MSNVDSYRAARRKERNWRWSSWVIWTVAVLTIVAVVAASLLLLVGKPALQRRMRAALAIDGVLSPGYQLWRDSTANGVATTYSWTVFNVTNADDVMHRGALPRVEAVGPLNFRYRKYRPESHIRWLPNGTMRYVNREEYTFLPDAAFPSLEGVNVSVAPLGLLGVMKTLDRFGSTTASPMHVIAQALAAILNNASALLPSTQASFVPPRETFFLTMPLKSLFFDATDPWLRFLQILCGTPTPAWNDDVLLFCLGAGPTVAAMSASINLIPADDATRDEPWNEVWSGGPSSSSTVAAGDDPPDGPPPPPQQCFALQLTKWEQQDRITAWNDTSSSSSSSPISPPPPPSEESSEWWLRRAMMINGSDGCNYPPNTSPSQTLYAFSTAMRRSLPMCYLGPAESDEEGQDVGHLTNVMRFGLCPSIWETASQSPANVPFRTLQVGLLEIPFGDSRPIVFSLPYCAGCNASSVVTSLVIGPLAPPLPEDPSVPSIYSNLVDVEPITGTPINIWKSMQFNVRLGVTSTAPTPSSSSSSWTLWTQLRLTRNMSLEGHGTVIHPVGFEVGRMSLPGNLTTQLYDDIWVIPHVVVGATYALLGVAGAGGGMLAHRWWWARRVAPSARGGS